MHNLGLQGLDRAARGQPLLRPHAVQHAHHVFLEAEDRRSHARLHVHQARREVQLIQILVERFPLVDDVIQERLAMATLILLETAALPAIFQEASRRKSTRPRSISTRSTRARAVFP